MRRLLVIVGILPLVTAAGLAGPASAEPIDGFVEADVPVTIEGSVQTQLSDATFWIQNPAREHPASPLVLDVDRVEVIQKVYEVRSAHSPLTNHSADMPPAETRTDRVTLENATIEISALGRQADVLLGPADEGAFLLTGAGSDAEVAASVSPDGMVVRDGYREMHNIGDDQASGQERDFYYDYEIDAPLVTLAGVPAVGLAGSANGYIWDAHVVVWNETRNVQYDTGAEVRSEAMGTTQEERYEYLMLRLDGLEGILEPSGLDARLLSKALRLDVDGATTMADPSGTLSGEDGLYRMGERPTVVTEGNLSLALTPGPPSDQGPRITVGITGDLDQISIPVLEDGSFVPAPGVVAASAGGATLVGLAAWYVVSAKGATMAIPFIRSRRDREEPNPTPAVQQPGDLLFDPDRFTLYHLVRSRVGLSAEDCRRLTGIGDAGEHLDVLVEHGLLDVLSEDPCRYCMPGSVDERRRARIAFLRDPLAQRLGELLAVHGLIPEERLVERVRRTEGSAQARRVPELIQAFVREDLAYRERGEDGFVVDPTDELFRCLDRMGVGSVPEVS